MTNTILSLVFGILIAYTGYLLWIYAFKPAMYRVRYHELYRLHLLELDLKERKLSFEFLDELYYRVCKPISKRETLASIDEEHKADNEEAKKTVPKK